MESSRHGWGDRGLPRGRAAVPALALTPSGPATHCVQWPISGPAQLSWRLGPRGPSSRHPLLPTPPTPVPLALSSPSPSRGQPWPEGAGDGGAGDVPQLWPPPSPELAPGQHCLSWTLSHCPRGSGGTWLWKVGSACPCCLGQPPLVPQCPHRRWAIARPGPACSLPDLPPRLLIVSCMGARGLCGAGASPGPLAPAVVPVGAPAAPRLSLLPQAACFGGWSGVAPSLARLGFQRAGVELAVSPLCTQHPAQRSRPRVL